MKRFILATVLIFICTKNVFAIDCNRPIEKLFTGDDPSRIYVIHGDGYANSRTKLEWVDNDENIINRMLTIILAAQASGKSLTFRYEAGDDGSEASCKPTVPQRLTGVWINY